MDHEIASNLPDFCSEWQLWHQDMFDRDASPSLQASGTELVQGLFQLWRFTLKEGLLENGNASFSRFHLTCRDRPSARVDIEVSPFHNPSLMNLRRLVQADSQDLGCEAAPGRAFLLKVAQQHAELLYISRSKAAPAIDWSAESREILVQVAGSTDADLRSGLAFQRKN